MLKHTNRGTLNMPDSYGFTRLDYAYARYDYQIINLLEKYGAIRKKLPIRNDIKLNNNEAKIKLLQQAIYLPLITLKENKHKLIYPLIRGHLQRKIRSKKGTKKLPGLKCH